LFITPSEVRMAAQIVEAYAGPDVLQAASAVNGIVAVDDGGTWAGVTQLALPLGWERVFLGLYIRSQSVGTST
jgi:hypothetical protein